MQTLEFEIALHLEEECNAIQQRCRNTNQTVFAAVSSCLLATPGNHLQCLWKVFTYLLKSLTADHLT